MYIIYIFISVYISIYLYLSIDPFNYGHVRISICYPSSPSEIPHSGFMSVFGAVPAATPRLGGRAWQGVRGAESVGNLGEDVDPEWCPSLLRRVSRFACLEKKRRRRASFCHGRPTSAPNTLFTPFPFPPFLPSTFTIHCLLLQLFLFPKLFFLGISSFFFFYRI